MNVARFQDTAMRFLGFFLIFILSYCRVNGFYQSSEHRLCHVAEKKGAIQMDMAANSADYHFNHSPESDKIAIDYIEVERKNNGTFYDAAWLQASEEWQRRKLKVSIPEGLLEEHVIAVLCYTSDQPPLYRNFNKAIRNYGVNDEIYSKCFHYKSLHYFLSVTLSILQNSAWRPDPGTRVYRGMDRRVQVSKGENIRFGQFASTSLDIMQSITTFTNEETSSNTLFNITTAHGVSIQNLSFFRTEEEVLIPPHEVFKVTKVVDWEDGGLGVNIVLSSIGTQQTEVRLESDGPGHLRVVRVLEAPSLWWASILIILLILLLALCIVVLKKRKLISG
ncbi:erythroblast NAD(P)(+)--arginine ADP-ribosyltransferase-like [Amblyraja radiata]|uniref:erythroblast NAD(P)(+)--arginine ADP-ribosyltransferase-like n=1 Tax=Amblyraja radiata TaxID=386614 RepID=UPI001402EF38|nr:erythroblast NAD(P)(+)--arginine ADP-ribosyltransferase-like [Amblyraja radiata]